MLINFKKIIYIIIDDSYAEFESTYYLLLLFNCNTKSIQL